MSKGLEALESIKKRFYWEYELCENLNQMKDETSIIEKELKVLEIIKNTWKLSFFDEEQMITIDNCYSIIFYDKEEYDSLKEVLL